MGGFFGVVSKKDCTYEVFFGTDYHSHLGTKRAGLTFYDKEKGFQRQIHNIENTPFRTKFEGDLADMRGHVGVGVISDTDPQPLLVRSHLGMYSVANIGLINNAEEIVSKTFENPGHYFMAMSSGKVNSSELLAALINRRSTLVEGIKYAEETIEGSASMLIMTKDAIIAVRDKLGRLPIVVGKNENGHCVSTESFACQKLGFEPCYNLGPGEVVKVTEDGIEQLTPPGDKMKICAFLWSYYGYPNSNYEGKNVEVMRCHNGEIMARNDRELGKMTDIDYVCGVPDSGTPHAIGYANESKIPFARPYIKYTPTWSRSFMSSKQTERNKVAKMKQIPVHELIKDKNLLFVDDSIVRGTQLRETVEFLYENGAKSVHIRSACPPIMYGCKYLDFSRNNSEMDLIARQIIVELEGEEGLNYIEEYSDFSTERGKNLRQAICDKLHFSSLEFQSLDGIIEAIGLEPCKLCTYCWTGKE